MNDIVSHSLDFSSSYRCFVNKQRMMHGKIWSLCTYTVCTLLHGTVVVLQYTFNRQNTT